MRAENLADRTMFHRKRHHHTDAVVTGRCGGGSHSLDSADVDDGCGSDDAAVGASSTSSLKGGANRTRGSHTTASFRHHTSPACPKSVKIAAAVASMVSAPDIGRRGSVREPAADAANSVKRSSPSPIRSIRSSPSLSPSRSLENHSAAAAAASTASSSSLTGLFRRKKNAHDGGANLSASFHCKHSSTPPKPLPPPKPRSLNPHNCEVKGRSLSPLPSGSVLSEALSSLMVRPPLHLALFDPSQCSNSHADANKTSAAHQEQQHQHNDAPQRQHRQRHRALPILMLSPEKASSSSEPPSPSRSGDFRQKLQSFSLTPLDRSKASDRVQLGSTPEPPKSLVPVPVQLTNRD